ncbi:hypothetical protein EJ110_NYTH46654 [Nymphaea thermarum]|nr:hypothetical protein EJ110_NYTH46654 [Nymphaea thermarum]
MTIVANIPNALENEAYVTNGKLKAQFSEFSPTKVTLMWDALGFRGMAVVEFEKNWTGFYCAISFEKSFELRCRGKTEWIESKKCDSSMYAWLARKDDNHNSDDYVKMQLHRGDLKTISELPREEERKKNTLVDDLTLRIDEKNKELKSSGEQLMEMTYSLNQFKSALERKDSEMARLLEERLPFNLINEATITEEQARQHIRNLLRDAWRRLNKELLLAQQQQQQATFSHSFLNVALNIARSREVPLSLFITYAWHCSSPTIGTVHHLRLALFTDHRPTSVPAASPVAIARRLRLRPIPPVSPPDACVSVRRRTASARRLCLCLSPTSLSLQPSSSGDPPSGPVDHSSCSGDLV